MLEQLTFTGRELLIAVVLATAIYLFVVLLFSRRRKQSQVAPLEARLAALENEIATLNARLQALEARPPAESSLDTQAMNYAEAVRLARGGAAPEELAGSLGMSRAEAELIIALHRNERIGHSS